MIELSRGNLLTADVEALVNTVNTDGVMGKGIALQFARAFPEMLPSYEAACRNGELAPGRVHVFQRGDLVNPRFILNFPTKRHWRGKSRMSDIEAGLVDLVRIVREHGIRSIAVPPLGCGLGGLQWDEVRPRIEAAFAQAPEVRVLLYAPGGAPRAVEQPNRTTRPALTPARARVIEVLAAYLGLGYELSLLEVHKLLYFLQIAGEALKLRYSKGTYGPYADNLRQVLNRFEGHYTRGYGDGSDKPDTEIDLLPGAQEAAAAFLAQARAQGETDTRLERVVELIEGFESPYGMELLATVHWVAANDEGAANTLDEAVQRIHAWTARKQRTMPREHIELAWNRLHELGWLGATAAPLLDVDEAAEACRDVTPAAVETDRYADYTREQLIRLLQRRDAERQLGLVWERDEIEADRALNDDFVALELDEDLSYGDAPWDNLIIEGDNYDALRYLRMTHAGRIRCIYIDPPYNTGNRDFVYNDRFVDKTHRFRHSLWLEFMYRRLTLARDLLAEDGVIFVSIDDNEVFRLGMLMDRVFGEDKHVATCIWQKRYSRENRGAIGDAHEYLLVYARDPEIFKTQRNLVPLAPGQAKVYKNFNNDPKGRWRAIPMTAQGFRPNQMYKIIGPDGTVHSPPEGRCWSTIESEFFKLQKAKRIYFGKNGKAQPSIIRYLSEVDGVVPWTWWPHDEVGHTDEARKEIQSILGTQTAFDTPKPVRLIERVLQIAMKPGDVALDFFAGSGTLAQAVAKLNAEDGGQRRFILVSNTEATDDQPDKNLCRDVCAERVRRVMGGYANAKGDAVEGLGGSFAYLRAQRVPRHRLSRRLGHAEIWNALQLIHDLPLQPARGLGLRTRESAALALAYLPGWNEAAVAALDAWCRQCAQMRVVVYSWTPERLQGLPNGIDLRPIPASLRLRFGGARA